MQSPWYENDQFWETFGPIMFDARRVERAAAEIDAILAMIPLAPNASILDMPCGVGRHSVELARRGFRVTGVDRTRMYLARAKDSAAQANAAIELVESDMRHFVRPDSFDACLSLYTSMGYFEDPQDDRRVLDNYFQSLRAGGSLLLELHGKETLARIFNPKHWREQDGIIILEDVKITDDWSAVDNRWIVIDGEKRHEFRFNLRIYSARELTDLLRQVGFSSCRCFGSFEQTPYDHQAARLLIVATK